jgi:hypothetical protein
MIQSNLLLHPFIKSRFEKFENEGMIMNDVIHWVYEGTIVNRRLVDEKLEEIVAHVKANEPGALAYEYCLNEDESKITIYERYKDNQAVLAHGDNMQMFPR